MNADIYSNNGVEKEGFSFMGSEPIVLLCVYFLALFGTYFVRNVSITSLLTEKSFWISEQRLLTAYWTKILFFNKSDAKDLVQTPDKALIPVIRRRKRRRYRGRRSGAL
jgi:hypothetical protein